MAFGENPTPIETNETQENSLEKNIYNKAQKLAELIPNGELRVKEKVQNGSKGESIYTKTNDISSFNVGLSEKSFGNDITFGLSKYDESTGETQDTKITILGTGEIEIDGKKIPDDLKEKVLKKIENEINELNIKKQEIEKQKRLEEQAKLKAEQEIERQEAEQEIEELMKF